MILAASSVLIVPAAIVVGAIIIAILLFKAMWRVAEPNEALIISGLRDKGIAKDSSGDEMGFRIVTGKGTLVVPGVQAVRRLSLDLHQADLQVDCVTHQGIPVHVSGTVIFKIGDDPGSITNAARRFLDQQNLMDQRVHNVFAGHLRSIVGSMTVEDMIRDREQLTARTREASGSEMTKLGLIIDSLQIQEIDDPTGYIKNLAMPHTAAVASAARIAQADADREATEREQQANALKAEAQRNAAIKEAGFQAEVDKANAEAAQAGPLAQASARQNVVEQETHTAQLEAAKQQQILVATVIRPAEAKRDADIATAQAASKVAELTAEGQAKRTTLEAEAKATATRATGLADADATRARGLADGEAIQAKGLAEAAAIKARAEALATNPEAVAMQGLAERWPEVVREAAGAFAHVQNFTVLDGAAGVNRAVMEIASSGIASFEFLRGLFVPKSAAEHAKATAATNGVTVMSPPNTPAADVTPPAEG
ncbi:MAG: flotillin family protein [Ilumatobacteraceae bacterium]|nr:flotillin family protein [Ilumatobacteraceae bacterium]